MDDDDSGPIGSGFDDDLSLPKATLTKLIHEYMPSDLVCAKEVRDLMSEIAIEFIHLVSSEANEVCDKESKKTIAGEHVIAALKNLGFEEYIAELEELIVEHQKTMKEREKKTFRLEDTGLSQEELLRAQEELFQKSRQRMSMSASSADPSGSSSSTTQPPSGP